MLSYLRFWLKSSNQHGVHSPFVYNYLTKGLYEVQNISEVKQLNWILKTIKYFNPSKIYVTNLALSNSLGVYKKMLIDDITKADLIFISEPSLDLINKIVLELSSKQMIVLIQDTYSASLMQAIRNDYRITLVLDFYIGALISKRKEQLKQNFFLRL